MGKLKIDVVIVPLSGHLYPTMNLLMPLLKNPRYDIRLFTGQQKRAVAEAAGFKVVTILEGHEMDFERVANNKEQLCLFSAYRQLSASLDIINLVSDQLLSEWKVSRPDLVIADYVSLSGGLVAEQMGIPWITTMATQFAIETTDGPPCFFGGMGSPKNRNQLIQQWLGRKLTRFLKCSATFLLRNRLKRYGFKMYNHKGQESIYSPYSILGIGMKELEIKKGFPEHYHWVGPTGGSVERCEDYPLDLSPFANRKIVFVTCGTQLDWAKDNLIYQTKLLAKSHPECQFFVTLGLGGQEFQCQKLMDNVSVVSYLPYNEYIPQMDYVIHHGGAGIFYQCIIYGKPALILPHDYDQFDYGVRADLAEIAYVANLKSRKSILKAFDKMLERKEWKNL